MHSSPRLQSKAGRGNHAHPLSHRHTSLVCLTLEQQQQPFVEYLLCAKNFTYIGSLNLCKNPMMYDSYSNLKQRKWDSEILNILALETQLGSGQMRFCVVSIRLQSPLCLMALSCHFPPCFPRALIRVTSVDVASNCPDYLGYCVTAVMKTQDKSSLYKLEI